MCIDSLVDEVLALIFDYVLYNPSPAIESLRLQLPVLGVCRKWRYLALPHVYKRVYVSASNSIFARRRRLLGDSTTKTFTNASLAAANGNLGYCRHIIVRKQCLLGRFADLSDSIAVLVQNASCWSAATALTVDFVSLTFRNANDAELTDAVIESFARMASDITRVLPNIAKLHVHNNILDARVDKFLEALTDGYSQQLCRLQYGVAISAPEAIVLSRLKYLDIAFTSDAAEALPYVCRETIECLRLKGLPHRQLCFLFGRDSASPATTFPSLKYLSVFSPPNVDMSPDIEAEMQQYIGRTRLHLPSLQWLYLNNSYRYCPILATAVLPSQMEIFWAVVSPGTIMMLGKSRIPASKRLSISLCNSEVHDSQVLVAAINHIYASAQSSVDTRLTISCVLSSFTPETIGSTNITNLSITVDISIGSLLGFINKLPNLNSVSVNIDQVDACPPDLTVPAVGELDKHPLVPFRARILCLQLNYQEAVAGAPINNLVKYLLLRLPHLERLDSYMTFKAPIAEFVELYTPIYPHLPNVRLVLNPRNVWL